ncbi:MAG TPA: hypothetical protein VK024_07775 [Actinomycetaceae bacterium]|nr:hypothetical protein [Actinomycetaceae bacterium]
MSKGSAVPTWHSRLHDVRVAIKQLANAAAAGEHPQHADTADSLEALFADISSAEEFHRAVRQATRLYTGGMGSFQDVGSAAVAGAVERLHSALREAW